MKVKFMSLAEDMEYLSSVYEDMYEAQLDQLEHAVTEGLWLDRKGELYEMHELSDHHIACIIRFDNKLPADYEPLVALVKKEKALRDSKRKNKFFGEEMIL